MKRKVDTPQQVEAKIPSLSNFLKEENLNVEDIECDVNQFLEYYDQFIKLTTDMLDKKEKLNPINVSHIIIKFKELNRKAQFRLNISREKTKETKDAINKNHLVMQNLLYEALHLEKETNSCLEFKSLHEDIELISVDEFMQVADEELKTYTNEHELTLNRLHGELIQRKNLSMEITSAEEMEQQLISEINKKRQAYNEISTHLKSVFNTTEPLENIFDLPMHHQDEQNILAELLPEPLYVLYVQMKIQADLDDQDMRVELIDENNSIKVIAKLTINNVLLILEFQWDSVLELVTVFPKLIHSRNKDISSLSKCLLEPSFLLSELPGDPKTPSDSPWIRAKLEKAVQLDLTHEGVPYLWCQQLTGKFSDLIQEYNESKKQPPSQEYQKVCSNQRVSPPRMLSILIRDIRDRLTSRLKLCEDIDRVSIQKCVSSNCYIINWEVSNFSQFRKTNEASTFVNTGLVNDQCFYFSAAIRSNRYQDKETPMWFIVPHNYPVNNSIVVLSKSSFSPDIRSEIGDLALVIHLLEVEVNCYCEEFQNDVISGQITRLLFGMDILLDYLHSGCVDNNLKKILIGNKYPTSKRPFKYN